jgi:hypothetical protein
MKTEEIVTIDKIKKDYNLKTTEEVVEFIWFKLYKNGNEANARKLIKEVGGAEKILKKILNYDNNTAERWKLDWEFEDLGVKEMNGKLREEWKEDQVKTQIAIKKGDKASEGKKGELYTEPARDYKRVEIPLGADPVYLSKEGKKEEGGKLLERKPGERVQIPLASEPAPAKAQQSSKRKKSKLAKAKAKEEKKEAPAPEPKAPGTGFQSNWPSKKEEDSD